MLAPQFAHSRPARLEFPPILLNVLTITTMATRVMNDDNNGKSKKTFMLSNSARANAKL
jgi:hypothetical protein